MESTLIKPVTWEKVLITASSPRNYPVVIESFKDKEGHETYNRVRIAKRILESMDDCEKHRYNLERASNKLFRLTRDDRTGLIRIAPRCMHNGVPSAYMLSGVQDGPAAKDIAATLHALAQTDKFNAEYDGTNIVLIAMNA